MKPSALLKYWSNRPLNKNQFLAMIHRDYNIIQTTDTWQEKTRLGVTSNPKTNPTLLMDYLYQSQGQLPAVVEYSQKEIDSYRGTGEKLRPNAIEYLIYSSHDTGWPGPIGEIDTSRNPRAPLDILAPRYITSDMTEQQYDALCSGWGCSGISNYGEDGIEIEFERLMVRVWEDEQQWASANYSLRAYLQNVAGCPLDTAEVYGYMLYKTEEYIQLEYRKSSIQSLNYPPTGDVV